MTHMFLEYTMNIDSSFDILKRNAIESMFFVDTMNKTVYTNTY